MNPFEPRQLHSRITIIASGLDADEDANNTQHYAKQLTQHGQVSESSGSNCSSPYSYSSMPFTQERTQGSLPYPYELSQAPKVRVLNFRLHSGQKK